MDGTGFVAPAKIVNAGAGRRWAGGAFQRAPRAWWHAQAIADSVAATEPLLALLDAQLAQHPFIAGNHLTLAEIPLACEMHRWWGRPLPHAQHPATPSLPS